MFKIKNEKRKTPRLEQLTALPSVKRGRLRLVKSGRVAFRLSRKIIGARSHWLILVTFNKNSPLRNIFYVYGAVDIPTATTTVPTRFSEFRFFEGFCFVRSDVPRFGPLL
jgi:hypothetical protein